MILGQKKVIFRNFRLLLCAATSWLSTNQPKTNKMAANDDPLDLKLTMYRQFFNVNTENGLKIVDGGVKVTQAVPEKRIINFFGLNGRQNILQIPEQRKFKLNLIVNPHVLP